MLFPPVEHKVGAAEARYVGANYESSLPMGLLSEQRGREPALAQASSQKGKVQGLQNSLPLVASHSSPWPVTAPPCGVLACPPIR